MESFKNLDENGEEQHQFEKPSSVFQRFIDDRSISGTSSDKRLEIVEQRETSVSVEGVRCVPAVDQKYAKLQPDIGRKLILDNIDIHQYTHDMTEQHQNPDAHYCSLLSTENRISSSHLPDTAPTSTLKELDNGIFCPSKMEHNQQRKDYVSLVGRILTENLPCMADFKDGAIHHIPHRYSNEMKLQTDSVSLL